MLRWIGLTLFDQRMVPETIASIGMQAGKHTCPWKAGCSFSKGHRALEEWREEDRKGVGEKSLALGQWARTQGPSLAACEKALKDVKAVRPDYVFTRVTLQYCFPSLEFICYLSCKDESCLPASTHGPK